MSYELIIMSPEGYRVGHSFTRSLAKARQKAAIILEDYPRYICRIYSYTSINADPVLVEVVK